MIAAALTAQTRLALVRLRVLQALRRTQLHDLLGPAIEQIDHIDDDLTAILEAK